MSIRGNAYRVMEQWYGAGHIQPEGWIDVQKGGQWHWKSRALAWLAGASINHANHSLTKLSIDERNDIQDKMDVLALKLVGPHGLAIYKVFRIQRLEKE